MADDIMRRRNFLAQGGIATAVAVTSSLCTADGQISRPSAPTNPTLQVADLVLQNGNIITVDAGFRIARAIAIAGDRIIAVGSDAAMTLSPWFWNEGS